MNVHKLETAELLVLRMRTRQSLESLVLAILMAAGAMAAPGRLSCKKPA